MAKVRDIMTKKVITVVEGTTVKDLCRLLGEFHISAIPVVTEDGRLSGIVSEKDIIAHHVAGLEPDFVDQDIYELISSKYLGHDDLYPRRERIFVEEVMNPEVFTVSPDAQINEAVKILIENQLHRLTVVEEGKVVGIISSLDILRVKPGQ